MSLTLQNYFSSSLPKYLIVLNHLAGVGVLIVIPRNYLNLSSTILQRKNHGLSCIEQRTESHTNDIAGYDLILVVTEGLSWKQPS